MTDEQKQRLKQIAALPFWVLVIIIVLLDDFFRSWVVPLARWVGSLSPFRWMQERIANWHRYAILALFLVPMAILEPLKLFSFYVIATHFWTGVLIFILAKILGIFIAERIFAAGKDKLMTIGWFKAGYDLWVRAKEWVYEYLRSTRAYPVAMEIKARVKAAYEALKGLVRAYGQR
jgi:hypothetical protein